MDAPHAERETQLLQCLMLRKNVLVDAIDERASEIEEHDRSMRGLLRHRVAASALHIYEGVQVPNSPEPV
jgi:hypothetical protein